jgi:ABC-2 type transport system permease protein
MSIVTSCRRFTRVVMRQLAADRGALFFFLVLPVVVIVVIGSTFGATGGSLQIGVVGDSNSRLGTAIADRIDAADGVQIERFSTRDAMNDAIRRLDIAGGVVLADDLDTAVPSGTAAIAFVAEPSSQTALAARDVVVAAVSSVTGPSDAGRFVASTGAVDTDTAFAAAEQQSATAPSTTVRVSDVGDAQRSELSAFSLTAPQNLVLFVFINSLAGGAALVRMRRTGVLRRLLAGPTGSGSIIVGLGAAWFVLALFQSVVVLAVGGLVFGVDWGDPVAATALTLIFALVGAGAGLLIGALFDDPDRVSAVGPPIGIVLGALGGCMVPLEVFPPAMASAARVVPQYWAMTAWQQLVFDGDGLGAIAVPLLVLAGFATAFFGLATVRLQRTLVRG